MMFGKFRLRRKDQPWEVVDSKFVDPVPTYQQHEKPDIDSVSQTEMRGTYVYDLNRKGYRGHQDMHHAVTFSRQQLLSEAEKRGYNTLLIESWQLTILRKSEHHRLEVRYSGRPAHISGQTKPSSRNPPYLGILLA